MPEQFSNTNLSERKHAQDQETLQALRKPGRKSVGRKEKMNIVCDLRCRPGRGEKVLERGKAEGRIWKGPVH